MNERHKRNLLLLAVGLCMVEYAVNNPKDANVNLVFFLLFALARFACMEMDNMEDNRPAFGPGM
ncbi:hypothetical protein Lgee_1048 [Legionella geestiana]|uniref:Uncharacterized protein n=1 Tax=Legionella geestiana TaxID=45065 RepID=A0A0W0TWH6_9GAMM|nr:hypothetical protein [Legionella geestiana]KTD00136.1 hypothetical protein Lgee_1048 [Legionella geestiana]QBS11819.1 hypothetical protein E4T54_03130 [Legionella geestiana]QDQ40566.1 hypothetical protein E3226_009280 [Legionella geestiana]